MLGGSPVGVSLHNIHPPSNPKARRLFRGAHAPSRPFRPRKVVGEAPTTVREACALPGSETRFQHGDWHRASSWGAPQALMMRDSLALKQTHGLKPSSS